MIKKVSNYVSLLVLILQFLAASSSAQDISKWSDEDYYKFVLEQNQDFQGLQSQEIFKNRYTPLATTFLEDINKNSGTDFEDQPSNPLISGSVWNLVGEFTDYGASFVISGDYVQSSANCLRLDFKKDGTGTFYNEICNMPDGNDEVYESGIYWYTNGENVVIQNEYKNVTDQCKIMVKEYGKLLLCQSVLPSALDEVLLFAPTEG
ncbi:MAG: hypothetical protein KDD48_06515 [Bdellovibrionales bacterium]|nr:hypothetical protein [Bdellovibrionales bacterium]